MTNYRKRVFELLDDLINDIQYLEWDERIEVIRDVANGRKGGGYDNPTHYLRFLNVLVAMPENGLTREAGLFPNPPNREVSMSGIFEQMAADIAAIKQFLAANQSQQQPVQQQPAQVGFTNGSGAMQAQQPVMQQPVQQPMQQQPVQPQQPSVNDSQIMQLVDTYGQDPNVRQAMQLELTQMGIQRLPEAPVDKYPEIYARFMAVIQRFQQQQPVQQQPQTTLGQMQQPVQQQPMQNIQANPGGISLI